MNIIKELQKESRWIVRPRSAGNIELIKTCYGKPIFITLRNMNGGKYQLEFPSYIFNSAVSHLKPSIDELRFCRNKVMLLGLIKALKRTRVWELVINKDFVVINDKNKKSDKDQIRAELKKVIKY